jgi:hypothetical protein
MSKSTIKEFITTHSYLVGILVCFPLAFIFLYIPVWQLVVILGIIGGLFAKETKKSALVGLIGVCAGWGTYALIQIIAGDIEILFDQVGVVIIGSEGFGIVFILLAIIIGGVLGLFGAIIGCSIRNLLLNKNRATNPPQ